MIYTSVMALWLTVSTSCVTNKRLISSVPSSEISNMAYFEPFSYIRLIQKGNKPQPNDSLSAVSEMLLDSLLWRNRKTLKLSAKIEIKDSLTFSAIENETAFLVHTILRQNTLKGIKLTPTIDSILENRNQRFALVTIASGFGRRKGNFGGQVAKGIGIGILTLGAYTVVPVKSNLTLYGIILDSKKNELSFYGKTAPIEKSPTDPHIVEKQLHKLFQGYFYKK